MALSVLKNQRNPTSLPTFLGFDVGKMSLNFALMDHTGQLLIEGKCDNSLNDIELCLNEILTRFPQPTLSLFEATGGYQHLLATCLVDKSLTCHQCDNLKVKAFAASRTRIKTDQHDARAIADYGRVYAKFLREFHLKNNALTELKALAERRYELVEIRKCEKQRLKAPVLTKAVQLGLKTHINFLNQQLADLETLMLACIKEDETVSKVFSFLLTLEGVGQPTAINLLAFCPELGQLKGKQIVALAGLAPNAKDSGQFKGYRSTGKGRKQLKTALFMATLATVRSNGVYHEFFRRKTQNSGIKMKAMTATAAKLITVINAKVRDFAIDNNLQLSR